MSTVRMPGPAHVSPNFDARSAPTTPSNRMSVVDRSKADPQIVKAAEGIESVFLDHMMQTMRKSIPENEISSNSKATEIYQGMLDSEYAKIAARTGGIGLADLIIAYLDSGQYTHGRGASRAPGQGEVQGVRQDGQKGETGNEPTLRQATGESETHLHGGTDEGR